MKKLNYGRTFLVGLAFLSISAFWQMYDNVIPLILRDTFGVGDTLAGLIMAADNVLALFLLPFFGSISDKANTRFGKRKPFIVTGTALAVSLMMILPHLDNSYYLNPSVGLKIGFIAVLGILLVSMGTYRSPAVALMPDVTPKPLRSKANAVINLMGAIGGILYLLVTTFMYSSEKTAGLEHVDYYPLFIIVAAIMVVSVFVMCITIREKRLAAENAEYENNHPEDNLAVTDASGNASLPKEVKRSLVFILISISLWFAGYNAVTTAFTKYASTMWNMSLGSASLCLTIATLGAIISYIPIGHLASKIGRKKTIISGVILLSASFAAAYIYTLFSNEFSPILYVLFALVGLAWAAINVNSLPMVVEMCKGSDIGKFTGLYYTFSMSAQIITPVLSGALLQYVGYETLFPYASIFAGLALVTMSFVKHGDNKPTFPKSEPEMLDVDA